MYTCLFLQYSMENKKYYTLASLEEADIGNKQESISVVHVLEKHFFWLHMGLLSTPIMGGRFDMVHTVIKPCLPSRLTHSLTLSP